MKKMITVLHDISKIKERFPGASEDFSSVVTIGNFDGFHRGHRALLKTLQDCAAKYGVPSVVVTFSPHPTQVLFPDRSSQRMFEFKDQSQILTEIGVDILVEESFTKAYAELSPEEFFLNKIWRNLKPRALIVGYDFCFGKNRSGNLNKLQQLCQQSGVEFVVEPACLWQGQPISSSRIREALREGDARSASQMLGRFYYFSGVVDQGARRGTSIGIPTANIYPQLEFVPRWGVYASHTIWQGQRFFSITNFGISPTFTLSKEDQLGQDFRRSMMKVETHIFEFAKDIYGHEIKVELLEFIRPERKFDGVDSLLQQIQEDVLVAENILNGNK